MKKIILIVICIYCSSILLAQAPDDHQFILNKSVNLAAEIGVSYQRIEISQEDIRIADSLSAKFLPANYRHYDWTTKIDNYYDYFRQYAGYSNSSAGRILFINGFRKKKYYEGTDPLTELVSYKGGGAEFFKYKNKPAHQYLL